MKSIKNLIIKSFEGRKKKLKQIAYNVIGLGVRWGFPALKPIDSTNFNLSTNDYR
jgi:hypothetical protein